MRLEPSTTYYVVFSNGNANDSYELIFTDATEEDGGAEAGWSIGDEGQLSKNGGSWDGIGAVFCIAVRGIIYTTVLSDLEISAGGSDVPLSPDFSPAVTSYTASIGNSVTEITVLPTVEDGGSTVEYLDANDAAITDGDAVAAGLQFSPAVGRNTIKVKVTVTDATVRTYTVALTRGRNTTWSATRGSFVTKARRWKVRGCSRGCGAAVHHRWQSRWLHAHASSRRDPKHRVRGPTGGEHLQRIVGGARLEAVHAGEPGFP